MSKSHWVDYHRRWALLTPLLRPNEEVAERVAELVAGHSECVLLLGVTPELAGIGSQLIGIDLQAAMVSHIWPGDTKRRFAMIGDWLNLPFPRTHFSAAIGDAVFNNLTYPADYPRLFDQLERVVRPGGRFVCRLFEAPGRCESLEAVQAAALAGTIRTFNALKWRLAMAIVAEAGDPNIVVEKIRAAFDRHFPDRAWLAEAAGWRAEAIDTIDAYRDSSEIYSFPTRAELLAVTSNAFAKVQLVPVGSYELAERCPLVVMDLE
jgi:SAM-dependent methyltransferase